MRNLLQNYWTKGNLEKLEYFRQTMKIVEINNMNGKYKSRKFCIYDVNINEFMRIFIIHFMIQTL